MNEKSKNPVSEMLDQGLKNYEQALRAGLKIQEDAGQWWTRMINQAASPQDLQKQISSYANEVIPATRKSLNDCAELIERNSRTSVDLLKKGLEAAQATNYTESQGKVFDFCDSSLKALKANAQAIVDLNAKAMDSWIAFMRKAAAEVPEPKGAKA